MADVRKATVSDRAEIAGTLASAFSEDPLFSWIAGPRAPLEVRLRIFFAALAKATLRRPDHLLFVSDDGTGAALWQPVDRWKVPPGDLIRAMPAILRAFRTRVPAMMGALNAIEKAHPSEPHYYLEILGTRKERQGKGVGSSVMTPMLEQCDREGLGAYLENSNPRNIPFYARHGFEVREEVSCAKDGPALTTMWREPRG